MIALSTSVSLPPSPPRLSYGQAVMSLGSCFSQSIATRLRAGALDVLVNPFGIQYNPLSIAAALERILEGRPFEAHRERLERLEAKLAAFYRKYPSALDLAALV